MSSDRPSPEEVYATFTGEEEEAIEAAFGVPFDSMTSGATQLRAAQFR